MEEGDAFGVAGGAKAGGDGVEVGVVVTRVADKFPDAVWHGGEDGGEGFRVDGAGGGDAEGAVGGEDAAAADLGEGEEAGAQILDGADFEAAKERALAEGEAPGLLEWIADGGDAGALGYEEKRAGDCGEGVGVLVRVDVRDGDAVLLDAEDLGVGFLGDVGFMDAAEQEVADEVGELGSETAAVGTEECGDGVGRGEGGAVGEDDVAADGEGGVGAGDGNGVVECAAAGHEGGGG